MTTIECPPAAVLQEKYWEGNYGRNGRTDKPIANLRSPQHEPLHVRGAAGLVIAVDHDRA
jgi:hypothetical protein